MATVGFVEGLDVNEISVRVDLTDPGCRYQTRASHYKRQHLA